MIEQSSKTNKANCHEVKWWKEMNAKCLKKIVCPILDNSSLEGSVLSRLIAREEEEEEVAVGVSYCM